MQLNLVFFNRSFYPDITATGQLLTELCEDLVKDYACGVTVITGRPLITDSVYPHNNFGTKIIKKGKYKGIEILTVRNTAFSHKSFLGRVLNYLTYFFLSFFASFSLKKPDIIITLTDPPIIGLVGLWLAFRFRVPLVISVRDIFPEAASGLEGSRNRIFDFLLDRLNRFCFNKAKCVVALGKNMRRCLIENKGVNPDKISIIPDWADCAKISPVSKNNSFSQKGNLAGYFVVMYSGNLGASSGLEFVIESAHLLKDYQDIIFVFIGEGIMKGKLICGANNYNLKNVRFFPYQPYEELSYSLSSADVFVIPLKKGLARYSLPSKIYMILASSRPYIACVEDESEITEMTRKFHCGLLSQPEDAVGLAEKILRFYKDRDSLVNMGKNARGAALLFNRGIGVRAYDELFERLLKDKKGI